MTTKMTIFALRLHVSMSLCLRPADDVIIDCTMCYGTRQLHWHAGTWNMPSSLNKLIYPKECVFLHLPKGKPLKCRKCQGLSIYRSHISHKSVHRTTFTISKLRPDFALTLKGELRCVFRVFFKETWRRYVESTLCMLCWWSVSPFTNMV